MPDLTSLSLNQLAEQVHALAKEKGWHNDPTETDGQFLARACCNLHGEVSELWEAYRANKLDELCDKAKKMVELGVPSLTCLEEELADIVIRALDMSRRLDINIGSVVEAKHAYNRTRSFRHGGKVA